jgi:hypothetical protein
MIGKITFQCRIFGHSGAVTLTWLQCSTAIHSGYVPEHRNFRIRIFIQRFRKHGEARFPALSAAQWRRCPIRFRGRREAQSASILETGQLILT